MENHSTDQSTTQSTGMSLAEYAKTRGISIQAAAQSFRRHQAEMSGMFQRQGRKTILLPEGIEYLDSCRNRVPVEVTSPDTLLSMRDRIKDLESQLEKTKEDMTAEIQKKDARINDLEQKITEKDNLIMFKDQVIMAKDQQMLLLTTSQKKKGMLQKLRELITGVDETPYPGAENNTFSSQDQDQ